MPVTTSALAIRDGRFTSFPAIPPLATNALWVDSSRADWVLTYASIFLSARRRRGAAALMMAPSAKKAPEGRVGDAVATYPRMRRHLQLWSVFSSASISIVATVENVSDTAYGRTIRGP